VEQTPSIARHGSDEASSSARKQVAQALAKAEAAEAAAAEAAASQELSAHDASTARGRAAAAEAALETALATVQQLSAKHALASAGKVCPAISDWHSSVPSKLCSQA
jgi:hypothetical protein